MSKIRLDPGLYDRVCIIAEKAGYPTPDEFITHLIEKELAVLESAESDANVTERLRGLGYIE